MRRFFAYSFIAIGILMLLVGLLVPLATWGAALLAFGLLVIGIGGGLRSKTP